MAQIWRSKKSETPHRIEINLQTPRQLFNTFDPAPFHEKDLDSAAERYIVDFSDDLPINTPIHLVIHLPEDMIVQNMAAQFQDAIQRYFRYRAGEAGHQLRRCFREGRTAFLVGIIFLLSCLALRGLVLSYSQGLLQGMLAEGILIMGWVALWHPIDVFLYHWRPLLRRYKLLKKISRLSVEVKPSYSQSFYPDSH